MPSLILNLEVIVKVTQENRDRGGSCNSVTIYPEVNVTTCPDTVSLTKHAIAKTHTSNPANDLSRIYNYIVMNTYTRNV